MPRAQRTQWVWLSLLTSQHPGKHPAWCRRAKRALRSRCLTLDDLIASLQARACICGAPVFASTSGRRTHHGDAHDARGAGAVLARRRQRGREPRERVEGDRRLQARGHLRRGLRGLRAAPPGRRAPQGRGRGHRQARRQGRGRRGRGEGRELARRRPQPRRRRRHRQVPELRAAARRIAPGAPPPDPRRARRRAAAPPQRHGARLLQLRHGPRGRRAPRGDGAPVPHAREGDGPRAFAPTFTRGSSARRAPRRARRARARRPTVGSVDVDAAERVTA